MACASRLFFLISLSAIKRPVLSSRQLLQSTPCTEKLISPMAVEVTLDSLTKESRSVECKSNPLKAFFMLMIFFNSAAAFKYVHPGPTLVRATSLMQSTDERTSPPTLGKTASDLAASTPVSDRAKASGSGTLLHHTSSADDYLSALERYCELHTTTEEQLLIDLRKETERIAPRAIRMLSSHLQGQILSMLIRLRKPSKVLELGTFTGYGTLSMASGLPSHGHIISCELDAKIASTAESFINRSAYASQIDLRVGKAFEALEDMREEGEVFDFVFIDADKKKYISYLKFLLGEQGDSSQVMLSKDALVVVDNVLWKGLVLEHVPDLKNSAPDPASFGSVSRMTKLADAMHEFNTYVKENTKLEQIIFPLRDGLSVIQLREGFASG